MSQDLVDVADAAKRTGIDAVRSMSAGAENCRH
jgi:hypothetical protein